MNFITATSDYEAWIGRLTKIVTADLAKKHAKMANSKSPFPFLRATFYRWIHAGQKSARNWRCVLESPGGGRSAYRELRHLRDAEGRLAWGVNDFDEVAELAYANDLVRLATSAAFSIADDRLGLEPRDAAGAILEGYRRGLEAGGSPFIIDERHRWFTLLLAGHIQSPVPILAELAANFRNRTDPFHEMRVRQSARCCRTQDCSFELRLEPRELGAWAAPPRRAGGLARQSAGAK